MNLMSLPILSDIDNLLVNVPRAARSRKPDNRARPVVVYVVRDIAPCGGVETRLAAYADWGESIGETFEIGQSVAGTVEFELDEQWVAANCKVVGIILERGGHRVRQANQVDAIASPDAPDAAE